MVGRRAHAERLAPGDRRRYIKIPPGSTNVAIGQDGSRQLHRREPGRRRLGQPRTAGYLSLAKFANQAGLERLATAVARDRELRRRRSSARPAAAASARRSAASSRCRTSTSPPSSPT